MDKAQIILAIAGGVITIASSVLGSYVAVKVTLTRHDEKLTAVKEELDVIKSNRESDFKELRSDIKNIYKNIAEQSKNIAVLVERTKSN
jgi:hypothetical protein